MSRARGCAVAIAVVAVAPVAGCRSASSTAATDGDNALDDANVPSITAGVGIGVFGSPNPDNGVPDPIFFVGCPRAGQAAVDLIALQPSGDGIDEGTYLASFTVTGSDVHIAIGSDLICDVDESTGDPSSAPFVYSATVSSNNDFYYTAEHTFAAHVLNPAMPAMNGLGEWNTDVLVTCPAE